MRCQKCGYISFDYLDKCKKCGVSLAEIREELCPLEMPPAEFSIWNLLSATLVGSGAVEPAPMVDVKTESLPALEISLEDQTETVILDEAEIKLEPEEPLLESSEGIPMIEYVEEPQKQPEIALDTGELILEESIELDQGKQVESITLDEISIFEPEIALDKAEKLQPSEETGLSLETEIPVIEPESVKQTAKAGEEEEEEEDIETLLKELDEVLKGDDE